MRVPDGGVVELQDVLLVVGLAVDKVAREAFESVSALSVARATRTRTRTETGAAYSPQMSRPPHSCAHSSIHLWYRGVISMSCWGSQSAVVLTCTDQGRTCTSIMDMLPTLPFQFIDTRLNTR
jgi:hypothetical protein